MRLAEIQAWVKQLLDANPALSTVPKIFDDGDWPKTPAREQALSTVGILIIIWEIDCNGMIGVSRAGLANQEIYVPVVVEENQNINRAAGGTQIPAMSVLEDVQSSLTGQKPDPNSPFTLLPMDQAFKNYGRVNGVNQIAINFIIGHAIKPL